MNGSEMRSRLIYNKEEIRLLEECSLCPRECNVNRFEVAYGYCKTGPGFEVASVTVHRGEEPVISGPAGICNIFFTGCNMQCTYCQNHEISRPRVKDEYGDIGLDKLLDSVEEIVQTGIRAVGFVSPSHVVPQVKAIIRGLGRRGLHPITVYNTNGYDKQSVIRELDGLIDVYLPDFKYASPSISEKYSGTTDYPEIVIKAIKEMYWQMGSGLITDNNGQVERGLIIRHLVLPGFAEESKKVLRCIAEEISTGVNISLMSQYHPVHHCNLAAPLNRTLLMEEYNSVVEEMNMLGFRHGWTQEMDSHSVFLPDFNNKDPFGNI